MLGNKKIQTINFIILGDKTNIFIKLKKNIKILYACKIRIEIKKNDDLL